MITEAWGKSKDKEMSKHEKSRYETHWSVFSTLFVKILTKPLFSLFKCVCDFHRQINLRYHALQNSRLEFPEVTTQTGKEICKIEIGKSTKFHQPKFPDLSKNSNKNSVLHLLFPDLISASLSRDRGLITATTWSLINCKNDFSGGRS